MYLWNTKALIDDLRNDQVTQKEQLKYFLLGTAALTVSSNEATYYTALEIAIGLIGTYLCYKSNSDGDNKDFIVRFICLSIPVNIRFLMPALICLASIAFLSHGFFPNIIDLAVQIASLILWIPYFYFLRSAMIQVSEVPDQTIST